jgi:methionyl-tRNA formyltransferase
MAKLRILFMGTAGLSCPSLKALVAFPDFSVVAVVTQPDRPKGRELRPQPSPVKTVALELGLPVLQPERARNEGFIDVLAELKPDIIVVVAYGQILPQAILDIPRFGCINVHTSLLPQYRGAAPIQWAIVNGEVETGVTIMKMDAGLDTGDILLQESTPIFSEDNSETLHDRLAQMGAAVLLRTIPDYVGGDLLPRPQPGDGGSYAPRIKKEDGHIEWNHPAQAILNRLRGLTPWPGVFSFLEDGPRKHLLKIWQAEVVYGAGEPGRILLAERSGITIACGERALRILSLQREGGKRLTAQQFLAGFPLKAGQQLL